MRPHAYVCVCVRIDLTNDCFSRTAHCCFFFMFYLSTILKLAKKKEEEKKLYLKVYDNYESPLGNKEFLSSKYQGLIRAALESEFMKNKLSEDNLIIYCGDGPITVKAKKAIAKDKLKLVPLTNSTGVVKKIGRKNFRFLC